MNICWEKLLRNLNWLISSCACMSWVQWTQIVFIHNGFKFSILFCLFYIILHIYITNVYIWHSMYILIIVNVYALLCLSLPSFNSSTHPSIHPSTHPPIQNINTLYRIGGMGRGTLTYTPGHIFNNHVHIYLMALGG